MHRRSSDQDLWISERYFALDVSASHIISALSKRQHMSVNERTPSIASLPQKHWILSVSLLRSSADQPRNILAIKLLNGSCSAPCSAVERRKRRRTYYVVDRCIHVSVAAGLLISASARHKVPVVRTQSPQFAENVPSPTSSTSATIKYKGVPVSRSSESNVFKSHLSCREEEKAFVGNPGPPIVHYIPTKYWETSVSNIPAWDLTQHYHSNVIWMCEGYLTGRCY